VTISSSSWSSRKAPEGPNASADAKESTLSLLPKLPALLLIEADDLLILLLEIPVLLPKVLRQGEETEADDEEGEGEGCAKEVGDLILRIIEADEEEVEEYDRPGVRSGTDEDKGMIGVLSQSGVAPQV
jgi:hypothetical protein